MPKTSDDRKHSLVMGDRIANVEHVNAIKESLLYTWQLSHRNTGDGYLLKRSVRNYFVLHRIKMKRYSESCCLFVQHSLTPSMVK